MVDSESGSRPLIGDVIAGKYRIDGIAGEGGMGIVYEAEHLVLGQRVALKVLLPGGVFGSGEGVERFCMEARAAARIESEHVVRVMDAASLPSGEPYLVMEYLDGSDLRAIIDQRGALPVPEAVDYALQGLEGLAHAHASGVIHRDLKPANLFLATSSDGRQVIKMLDFGISQSAATPDDGRLTGPRILGSPVYMSPEQLRNVAVDTRSDLWAFGVVLYELLCGEAPFDHPIFADLIAAVLAAAPVPLCDRVPAVPRPLSDVIARCLKREPADRWPDAAELARALAPYGSGAWAGAVDRIDRILARSRKEAPPSPVLRRFDSYATALAHLETGPLAPISATSNSDLPPASVASTLPPVGLEEPDTRVTRLPARPAPSSEGKPALRVLLIDDSEASLAAHERLRRGAGFAVRTTTSVGEFEVLLEGWVPHLVLMDVSMSDVSSDVLCGRVKARLGASVPIVLLSNLPREELDKQGRVGRADALLSKAVDGAEFVEYVRTICAITYSPEDLP